jgi:REP element-mobilizing transposase RayT
LEWGGHFVRNLQLDNLKIDNEILIDDLLRLSEYDFNTEVDVNILGHIFEHSLSEIEEITAELSTGEYAPIQISKRKKDGVFYTPKYITQYIVENTIGTLCNEKRAALEIEEIEFDGTYRTKDGKLLAKGKKLYQKLNNYKDWLLSLKIVDPACGSGAFLNQALNFLIQEHNNIDDIIAELTNTALRLFDTDKAILENNLYGVDINEESVEIAKLSLWLRTAQKDRKLSVLSNNIKCGNSLIDDPEIAGEKSFNWHKEFPQIFKKKKKLAWHITWVTHDTRTSDRMIKYKVRERRASGEMHIDRSVYLENEDAIKVTEIISEIVTEEKLNCLAYNICKDHIHMLLVCDKDELSNIVRKLKGKSAQKFKEHLKIPKDETFNLWAQKFDRKPMDSEQQLQNTIGYITGNREKHQLPDINEGLQPSVERMCCTYDHAFRTEYKGGFDVVIGNPPYKAGRHWADKDSDLHGYLTKEYETADYQLDLYVLFYERSLHLLKKNDGLLSFIAPNTWFTNISSKGMREYFLGNSEITQILDCSKVDVFEDAVVETAVVTMKYRKVSNNKVAILQLKESEAFILHDIEQNNWLNNDNFYMNIYVNEQEQKLKSKIDKIGTPLGDFCEAKFGVKIYQVGKGKPKQTKDIAIDRLFESDEKLSDDYFKMLEGKDVNRYNISWQGRWIKYGVHLAEPRNIELFQGNRFLVRRIMGKRVIACCTDEPMISNALLHVVKVPNEYSVKVVLSIVSSSLMAFYFRKSSGREDKAFPEIKVHQLRSLPIVISKDSLIIEPISDRILKITSGFYATLEKFSKYFQSQFSIEKLSKKLQNWYELDFGEFIKELNKAIKKAGSEKLSKTDEMDWMEVFETKKAEAQSLKTEIDKTDKEIDQMVYELYGLSEEEINIIERNVL